MRTYEASEDLSRSDAEITLGMRSILGIFFGLALICGVFFGFGYSLGRGNSSKTPPAEPAPLRAAPATSHADISTVVEGSSEPDETDDMGNPPAGKPAESTRMKPSAAAIATPQASGPVAVSENVTSATPAENPKTSVSAPEPLHAAPAILSSAANANPSAEIMVQIAAVAHREDVDVLLSALKKLGYNASARTEPTDNLLHVQVGPFATRDQAKAMRTKLLNDGYNAILK